MNRLKLSFAAAFLVGLILTVGAVVYVGAGDVLKSVQRIGVVGFLVYTCCNLLVFIPLGLAWWCVAPGVSARRAMLFPWGRLVREGASDVLPFSQLGGLVVGLRAVQQRGVSEALAIASQIVDLSTEMASQLVYTLFGAAMLTAMLFHASQARTLLWTTLLALLVGSAVLGAIYLLQGKGLDLIASVLGRWISNTRDRTDAVKALLKDIYARPRRLAAGFAFHALSWVLSGTGSWIAFSFIGVHIDLWKVLTLESLMAAVRAVAFMTPGALGFQEGAYVLTAPLFGLPAETALTLSLLKRAKDIVIGAPAVLAWQYVEVAMKKRHGDPAETPASS